MSSEDLPQPKVEAALEEAERLRQAGRYQEGLALLREALELGAAAGQAQARAKIYFRLGNIYFDAGDLERAEAAYKQAIALDPGHASAHHNLAVVYRRQGRIEDYIKQRKQALKVAGRRPVQLTAEQAEAARRLALRLFLFGLGLLALLALVLFLVSRL